MKLTRTAGPLGRRFGFAVDGRSFFLAVNAGWYLFSLGRPGWGCIYIGKWDVWVYSDRLGVDWSIGRAQC